MANSLIGLIALHVRSHSGFVRCRNPKVHLVGLGSWKNSSLIRQVWTYYCLAQLTGHLKQPRSPACLMNDELELLN